MKTPFPPPPKCSVSVRYFHSSSFKMAALFTALLGLSAALLLSPLSERLPHDLQAAEFIIIGLMLTVALTGFGVSYFVVSRINRIAVIAREIAATQDLSRRVPLDSRWDDLSSLADVFNGFLDRIELLMTGAREVSNNIAHDLRTPLAGLRGDLEALKGCPVDDKRLDELIAQTDKILGIFHSLLRISAIERGGRRKPFIALDMAALMQDVIDLYDPVAEEKQVRFISDFPPTPRVKGDPDLLFQMFANIIDNAVKFSPSGSAVKVSVYPGPVGRVTVTVEDQGPGVPDHEKDRVFKHFYRGDASRSTEGNGLGLSLAKAVTDLHHACMLLEDTQPCGLRVATRWFPAD